MNKNSQNFIHQVRMTHAKLEHLTQKTRLFAPKEQISQKQS